MSWTHIKKELSTKSLDTLLTILNNLYKSSKEAREHMDMAFGGIDETKLLAEYSEKVTRTFFPKRGYGCDLKKARSLVTAYNRLPVSLESKGKLALCYVEGGIRFTKEFGDIDMPFYTSVENMFYTALGLLEKGECLEKYRQYVYALIAPTRDFGWGFYDTLSEYADEFYER